MERVAASGGAGPRAPLERVTSADGTPIAFERFGAGPALVLVSGALSDRSTFRSLALAVADQLTAVIYDRRGRGDSGDAGGWKVGREIEDLGAVLAAIGGRAAVFGHSAGAILALEAALAGLPISRLVLYEAPVRLPSTREVAGSDLPERLAGLVGGGKREAAVRLFLSEAIRLPPFVIDGMRAAPGWAEMVSIAHTLPYDTRIAGAPADLLARLPSIAIPTLVLAGGNSPPWIRAGNEAVVAALPNAELRVLPGHAHAVRSEAVAPELRRFLPASDEG